MTRRTGLAVAAVLLLPACSLSFGSSAQPPPAPAGVRSGGVLRVGIVRPESIDPAQAYDRDGQLVVAAMCDPVLEVDPRTGAVYGGLSERVVAEPDGAGVTITLKGGLRFPDGSGVAVKDLRVSLSRLASDTLASPLADEIRTVGGFGRVHGDEPVEDEDDPSRTLLLGVGQVSRQVVTIAVTEPDPEFAQKLSRPWAAVLPHRTSERSDFDRQPVCVGPYRLAKAWSVRDRTIELVRSEHYHAGNEAYTSGGRGYPDRIVFRLYADERAALRGFVAGEVDVVRAPAAANATLPAGARLSTAPTSAMEYVGLPNNVKPFDDPRVRRALTLALDRTALLDLLARRDRVPATGLLPATMPDHVDNIPECTALAPATADVARARALLAEAKVSLRGVELPLYVNDEQGTANVALMRAVGEQWRAAFGIAPKVVPMSWNDYLARARETAGFDGPFRTSWSTTTPTPIGFLRAMFTSPAIGRTNLSRFSDVRVDRDLTRRVADETDDRVRAKEERALFARICAQAPLVPVWGGAEAWLTRDSVASASGEFQRPVDGRLDVRELYLRP